MQEMSKFHVDYYLNFFENHANYGSIIYLNNNKEYIYKGEWNYPNNWSLLFRHPSPWSWSKDCPVEVFVKGDKDYAKQNMLVNSLYLRNMRNEKNLMNIKEREVELETSFREQLEENRRELTIKQTDNKSIDKQMNI